VNAPLSFLYDADATTGVATITLNRPERLNALTFDVYDELRHTFRALDTEPGVRAIVLTGAGKAFCSGGDVHDIIGALVARDYRGLLEFTRMTCDLVLAIRQCLGLGRNSVVGTSLDRIIADREHRLCGLRSRQQPWAKQGKGQQQGRPARSNAVPAHASTFRPILPWHPLPRLAGPYLIP